MADDDVEEPCSEVTLRLLRLVGRLLATELVPSALRAASLRLLGARLAARSHIASDVLVTVPARLDVGEGVFVNIGCLLESSGGISLADGSGVGPGSMLLTTTHEVGARSSRAGHRYYQPIRVGEGSWIAANVTVLPGTVIGSGVIVAAGSVVRGELGDDGLYAGNPARRIRDLS